MIDREPQPHDFPPKSPHQLEWEGYDKDAYDLAMDAWRRINPTKSLSWGPGVVIGYAFIDEMFATVEKGGESGVSGALIRSMKLWDLDQDECEKQISRWLKSLHKQYNISSVYDKSSDMIYFRKGFIFRMDLNRVAY